MTPGQHIERMRGFIEELVDEHPLGPSGMMVYSDLMDDLDKVQKEYNCQTVKENQDGNI